MTVRRFRSGEPLRTLRDPLNRLVEAAKQVPRQGPPGGIEIRPLGTRQLEIKALGTDVLTCVDPGDAATTGALEHTVRLPITFTEASRGAVTYTYTDINHRQADATENQELTPVYAVGDFIIVSRPSTNDEEGVYIDLNVDGRQWAKVP